MPRPMSSPWRRLERGSGKQPDATHSHSAVSLGDHVYTFGGVTPSDDGHNYVHSWNVRTLPL